MIATTPTKPAKNTLTMGVRVILSIIGVVVLSLLSMIRMGTIISPLKGVSPAPLEKTSPLGSKMVIAPLGDDEVVYSQTTSLNVVVLGDSFSSGVGAAVEPLLRGYEAPHKLCGRSKNAWGHLYTQRLEENYGINTTFTNGACASALSSHLLEQQEFPNCYSWLLRGFCDPVEPQINHIDETVDLVLMTVLLNDLGMGDVVGACLVRRNGALCEEVLERQRSKSAIAQTELEAGLLGLSEKMTADGDLLPKGKVVIVSYPYLVLHRPGYLEQFTDAARELTHITTATQVSAAENVNAILGMDFVVVLNETAKGFDGHEAEPVRFRRNRDSWIHGREHRLARFHMNTLGNQRLAEIVASYGTFGLIDD